MLKKGLIALAVLVLIGIGSCSLLLPERFTVNAPIMNSLFGWGVEVTPEEELRQRLTLPDGFQINIYADGLGHARIMKWTSAGDLLLSTPRAGEIKLIERDRNGDGRADGVRTLLTGLNRPHGVEIVDGWLYIGETDAIARIRFDADSGTVSGEIERPITGLPGGGNHWTRTLRQGPDGWIYVNVGSSCNVCIEEDPRRATLMRFQPGGTEAEIYASGLRNTVGWDWQPGTGALYGVDNGRDLLGDDYPPCELNLIIQDGFYGWPYRNGANDIDPDFGDVEDPRLPGALPPAYPFPAHVAPLAITFLQGDNVPPGFEEAALVTFHGSWNRTKKQGYEIVALRWDQDGRIVSTPFLTGFEIDEDVIGRPVDVKQGPDGAIYVSDDYAGAIYRISYGADEAAADAAPASGLDAGGSRPVVALNPEAVARGEAVWTRTGCATCHDPLASPSGVALKELKDLGKRYGPKDLVALITTPPGNMPAFVNLSEDEKQDLAAYLLATYN